MRILLSFFLATVSFLHLSVALAAPAPIPVDQLLNKIHFHYSTSDDGFELDCKHWIGNPNAQDIDVICGKGTKTVKNYSVHLLIRTLPTPTWTSFEILYWVTDRNASGSAPAFSSHSQIFTVENQTQIKSFQMSQGLENDSAQLTLYYQP